MKNSKPQVFIQSLIVGLGLVAASPLPGFANTIITTQTNNSAFILAPTPGDLFVPIIFSSTGFAGRISAEPGFYHQAILLQKSSEQYFQSITFDFKVNDDGAVYIYKERGFQY